MNSFTNDGQCDEGFCDPVNTTSPTKMCGHHARRYALFLEGEYLPRAFAGIALATSYEGESNPEALVEHVKGIVARADTAEAFINDMVSEKALHGSNPSLIAKASKLGCLPDHVRQLIEGHVEGPTRLALAEGRVRELETERWNVVDALGCHPAHVLDEIGRITEKLAELPNIDRMRQAESRVRELEVAVRDAENTLIMSERRKLEAKLADSEKHLLALHEALEAVLSIYDPSTGHQYAVRTRAQEALAATPADLAERWVSKYEHEKLKDALAITTNSANDRGAERDAALAEVERLKAELEAAEATHDDEETAHQETLAELARVTEDRDAQALMLKMIDTKLEHEDDTDLYVLTPDVVRQLGDLLRPSKKGGG